ncbi:hypothetical protein SS50377_27277 [Spironucleus salmonicida]|uniref:Uncharacterized protein n=1 Tax=Spironucleus salmonicida TaxID=348837 RepID=V6LIA0_9EUKA|nr:hypothetical protein SS50377_27264 [Spironucleus salmonicida]KAH0570979.1 hypothetical protein SS50377_27273 [Spironucleus salmonicida]KAH0570983.1 hypothetical protein SS50377_27277 [Spironucleus salmonicida]|eukprot:EST44298.1 Hypothetical protein SS50377_15832 [Spironucleus salmonicida]
MYQNEIRKNSSSLLMLGSAGLTTEGGIEQRRGKQQVQARQREDGQAGREQRERALLDFAALLDSEESLEVYERLALE